MEDYDADAAFARRRRRRQVDSGQWTAGSKAKRERRMAERSEPEGLGRNR